MPAYVPPHLRGTAQKADKADKQQAETPSSQSSPQRQTRPPSSPYNRRVKQTHFLIDWVPTFLFFFENQETLRDPARDTSWGSRDNRRNNAPPAKNSRFNGMFE